MLLLDAAGRVLLFEGSDPARPGEPYWSTPGGGLEPGEDARAAAARALARQTGLVVPCERLEGPVWRRHAVFSSAGRDAVADEEFFVAVRAVTSGRACCGDGPGETLDTSGATGLERATVLRHRWWTAGELRTTHDAVYPGRLADLLGSVRPGDWDGVTRSIS